MRRRSAAFSLAAGSTALLTTGLSWLPREAAKASPVLPDDICSSQPREPSVVRQVALDTQLRYEGTHILAYGAMRALAARFQQNTRQTVAIRGGGCDDAIAALKAQVADWGGLCCPIESTPLRSWPHLVIAQDYKALVVHADNPVSHISHEQAMRLVTGELADWRELGGRPGTVALVVRKHCPDYQEPVRGLLMQNQHRWSRRGIFVSTDEKIVETTARFENGLGIVSWVYAQPQVQGGRLKVLSINGVLPGRAAGLRYPLMGPLVLAMRHWEPRRMRAFSEFLFSSEGQTLMAESLLPNSPAAAGYTRSPFAGARA